MTTNDGGPDDRLPIDPDRKPQETPPVGQIPAKRHPELPDSDIVTEPDGSGAAGGSSGTSSGGSTMPGHPDSAR